MQILLTGSGTLVGNSIVQYLEKKKIKLICTYRKSFPINISKIKNIKLIKVDLEKKIEIKDNFDTLIHCAAAIPDYKLSKKKIFASNVGGFKKLLQICKKNKCKKIILLSTTSVYGEAKKNNLKESYSGYKIQNYGKSKLEMEIILKNFCKENKCLGIILRMPGILGKNSKHNFLSKILISIKKKKSLTVQNPNLKFNNAIHIKNLCSIIFQSLKKKKSGIYNIASKHPLKLKNIINMIINNIHGKNYTNLVKYNESNNKGFRINIEKALREKYKFFDTKKTVLKFINDNKIK